jgi:preprotein translocase subunit SecA
MECEKCKCPWDIETHIPRILACGHTICQNCIEEIFNKIIFEDKLFKCPICNSEIMRLTPEDILNFKKNTSLLDLKDKIANSKNIENMSNDNSISMIPNYNESSFIINYTGYQNAQVEISFSLAVLITN